MSTRAFFTGCNYWASASGIYMWRRWNAGNVDRDFAALAAHGCTMLRMFPLWPDFQPLNRARGIGNSPGKVLYKDGPLPNAAGVDPEMVDRFRSLCEMAEKHGLELIVGLVTGWMSGRCFVPPALEALDPLTDPESIRWQVRYVRHLVRELKDQQAIVAWDLGNECNCLGKATGSHEAWAWTHAIASAIRLEDSGRPVISGMHGLEMDETSVWTIGDQAELTDVLTTHPYPLFTSHCNVEPSDGFRGCFHGTAESLYYAGVGGRPCFIEEAGSLGPGVMSETRAERLCRGAMITAWAHNLPGFLWWCAFRQNHLDYSPYDDMAVERDLGLFTQDYKPTPQVLRLKTFKDQLEQLPVLPEHQSEVVVLLTRDQEHWAVAYGCFLLAKQAGFDVSFQDAEQELRPAKAYWLPSVTGLRGISRHRYLELMERVRNGALLVASGHGMLEPFEPFFGVEVDCRYQRPSEVVCEKLEVKITQKDTQRLNVTQAAVLVKDDAEEAVLTACNYGAGECRFLAAPVEQMTGTGECQQACWKLVAQAFEPVLTSRMLRRDNPLLGMTEYELDERHGLAVIINYADTPQSIQVKLQNGWSIAKRLKNTKMLDSLDVELIWLER